MTQFQQIQSIHEATHTQLDWEKNDWIEVYGTTITGEVYRALTPDFTLDGYEAAVLDLERQAAEGLQPVASLTEYQMASLHDSQEFKLNEILASLESLRTTRELNLNHILAELEHSSASLPSLAAPLAA